jgi:hypothetical protein
LECTSSKCIQEALRENPFYDHNICKCCDEFIVPQFHTLLHLWRKNRGMNNIGFPMCSICFVQKYVPRCAHSNERLQWILQSSRDECAKCTKPDVDLETFIARLKLLDFSKI